MIRGKIDGIMMWLGYVPISEVERLKEEGEKNLESYLGINEALKRDLTAERERGVESLARAMKGVLIVREEVCWDRYEYYLDISVPQLQAMWEESIRFGDKSYLLAQLLRGVTRQIENELSALLRLRPNRSTPRRIV